jgi:Zinc carboxypeptidase
MAGLSPARDTFLGGCRTVTEMRAFLDARAAEHPDRAEVFVYGSSWEKVTSGETAGHDLFSIRLTNRGLPGPKPTLFLMAAIHDRELSTSELALRLVDHLLSNYGVDGDVTWLLEGLRSPRNPATALEAPAPDSASSLTPSPASVFFGAGFSFGFSAASFLSVSCSLERTLPSPASTWISWMPLLNIPRAGSRPEPRGRTGEWMLRQLGKAPEPTDYLLFLDGGARGSRVAAG